MKNKEAYYTPLLEDFFYGLKYDYNPFPSSDDWRGFSFNIDRPTEVLKNLMERPACFRLKYFCVDDLKNLGFSESINKKYVKFNGEYYIFIDIMRLSNRVVIGISTSVNQLSVRTIVVHSIRCNNLSEFHRLLSKLNIKLGNITSN